MRRWNSSRRRNSLFIRPTNTRFTLYSNIRRGKHDPMNHIQHGNIVVHKYKAIYFFMFVMLVSLVSAGQMKLLAVSEVGEELIGSKADLYLKIEKGEGRVFIETFPITKMDTQISTRFAKEIACSYLEENCDKYDFFYTIRGESGIIGGPSAGGPRSASSPGSSG